jgi:signal transduction histidine kinase
MRWWLAAVFALIVALTAVTVAELSTQRAESGVRNRAEEIATGAGVAAASDIHDGPASLADNVAASARKRRVSLFVFDDRGRPLTATRSRGLRFGSAGLDRTALRSALDGHRFVGSVDKGRRIVVGLPLRRSDGDALVAVALRPDLVAELGIVRDQIVRAALLAVVVGAVAGVLVALLIARRLRRVATAAAAIEAGDFETPLRPWFRDELGELSLAVDRMRSRLGESFADLASERNRLRLLLEQLHEGVVAVGPELRVEFANAVAQRLLAGHALVEGAPVPEPWRDVSLRRLAARLFEPGAAVVQARVSPEPERTYAIAGIPPGATTKMAVVVLADVSERERRERAEREFVANAAHELRTPIAAIAGAVEALEAGAKHEPADRDRFLALVTRQSARLGRLVRALLVLARAQSREELLRREAVPMRPLLLDVAAALDPAPRVVVSVDCDPAVEVLAQPDLVEQIVANLAANAVKHTTAGEIVLAAAQHGDDAVLEVRDSGRGIPPSEQDRIFDRFYSSDGDEREGIGLGLAIAREAARAVGATLEVESRVGVGTTMRVVLAAAARERRAA